jgi:hypothetical protein
MPDISGFQIEINIVASKSFPAGLRINQFADDLDPLNISSTKVADKAMSVNGDLAWWSTPSPLEIEISVMPNTTSDINLGLLLEANRVGQGKTGARDQIRLTINYPAGNFITYTGGAITDGPVASSVSSQGRLKGKTYRFAFENRFGG